MSGSLTVLAHFPRSRLGRLEAQAPDVEIVEVPDEGEVDPAIRGEILLTRPWGTPNLAQVLRRGVRWVHTVGTGVDRFPLDLLGGRLFTCSRGASATPIAEWVVAMMLAFEKRLPEAWITAPPARWNVGAGLGTLRGRVLGSIGLGSIALGVARRVEPFGTRVLACRRTDRPSPLASVGVVPFAEVIAQADHLLIAAPSTRATHRLLGRSAFAAMKPGVHLVNVARGAAVDHDALREALDSGRVARASLDTVDPEPLPDGHWLYAHPSVRLSPHVSWSMAGAFDAFLEVFLDNLGRYRRGEEMRGIVDLDEGY